MNLNYKVFGQGPSLFILHGLFGMLDNWQTLAKRFADTHTVYIIDQRNHGNSPHSSGMSYELMAGDLLTLMDDQGIRTTNLIGHSMGGKTAMRFALDHPALTEKLCVVDIGPQKYEPGHDEIFEALNALPLSTIKNRRQADEFLEHKIADKGIRQFLLKNLRWDKNLQRYGWKMNLSAIENNYAQILDELRCDFPFEGPSLFISGLKSDYLKEKDWPMFVELFPSAELYTIQDAGHWVHADQPELLF